MNISSHLSYSLMFPTPVTPMHSHHNPVDGSNAPALHITAVFQISAQCTEK